MYTQLKQHIDATIGSGNLREAVRSCPRRRRCRTPASAGTLTRPPPSAGAAAAWGRPERVVSATLLLARKQRGGVTRCAS